MTKKKTYADECLQRAKKATPGPWGITARNLVFYNKDDTHKSLKECESIADPDDDCLGADIEGPIAPDRATFIPVDAIFIANARTDVEELANRLKRACEALKKTYDDESYGGLYCRFNELIEELEAPLEKIK